MLWACLRFPHLALDGVLRGRATQHGPLALLERQEQRRTLSAVNDVALKHGLHVGQSVEVARVLCPPVECLDTDPDAVQRSHDFLAAWAYRYSSLVSQDFDGALLLEVEASFTLFGGWRGLRAQLRTDLEVLGFRHHLVLAPNPHAAFVLSLTHEDLAVRDPGVLRQALTQLPVTHAGWDAPIAQGLRRMGLRALGQVMALPRRALATRIGVEGIAHLERLLGNQLEPLTYYQPPTAFDQRIDLSFNTASQQALLFPLRRLVGDLSAFLRARDGSVQRFEVELQHEHRASTVVPIGLLSPEREAAQLFEVTRDRLERAALPAEVSALRVHATDLPAFVPMRRDLFAARPQQTMPWEQVRERLRARLGPEAVHGLATYADHRPEHAWQRTYATSDKATTLPSSLPLRPAWLLLRPIPLRETAPRILAGPERIESGWWDGADVRRDYYVIETRFGQRAWAFTPAGERSGFMLHGWFA